MDPEVGEKRAGSDVHEISLTCGICIDLMEDAVQVACCGTGFCRSCVTRALTQGARACPACRAQTTVSGIVPDPRAERLSATTTRDCIHAGCTFKANRAGMKAHMSDAHVDHKTKCAQLTEQNASLSAQLRSATSELAVARGAVLFVRETMDQVRTAVNRVNIAPSKPVTRYRSVLKAVCEQVSGAMFDRSIALTCAESVLDAIGGGLHKLIRADRPRTEIDTGSYRVVITHESDGRRRVALAEAHVAGPLTDRRITFVNPTAPSRDIVVNVGGLRDSKRMINDSDLCAHANVFVLRCWIEDSK
jgi:hypothetical protein